MTSAVVFVAALFASFAIVSIIRRVALHRGYVDLPNQRSSHTIPTPHGGGLAIVVVFLGLLPMLWMLGTVDLALVFALEGAGGLVAVIGLADDRYGVPVLVRLLVHIAAALWALWWLGGAPELGIAGAIPAGGWLLGVVTVGYTVWLVNLYNFMDGIDGIASIEALTVCVGAISLYISTNAPAELLAPLPLLAASTLGFAIWNYPPAKIFMGDVGSGFLGIVLAVLSISAADTDPGLLVGWMILLAIFVSDATVTLLRRLLRRKRLHIAHRSHAYQFASRVFGSHKVVSLTVGGINLLWLCPIALLTVNNVLSPAVGVALAYGPLVVLALRFRAGAEERQ